jgi:hypothetical protein
MNELIKENIIYLVIAMTRLHTLTVLGLVTIGFLLFIPLQHVTAINSGFIVSQPDVWAWGIEGDPQLGIGFDVWANVTDDGPGLRNVTVQANGPNMTINNLLTFNGTFHTGSVPAFPNDGTFYVSIRAYDMANVTRTSNVIIIIYESNPVPTIDPSETMPYVVGSSFGLVVLVTGIAVIYDRRKGANERSILPE